MTIQLLDPICKVLVETLTEIEKFQRWFYPPEIERLKEFILPLKNRLEGLRQDFIKMTFPAKIQKATPIFDAITQEVISVLETILGAPSEDFQQTVVQVMRSFRKICRVQENLYTLRFVSSHLRDFFLETAACERAEKLDPPSRGESAGGLIHFGMKEEAYARGTMSLYVPESFDNTSPRPLVVALHGGFGHGRDFIWTWLREAKSRQFFLLAPTSLDTTWSILEPAKDGENLMSMLYTVNQHWHIDQSRILVTGISDGGTFSLVLSLQENVPFTAYASIAGVLPPFDLTFAEGKRIYMVHGALDWMFPVQLARQAFERLEKAGSEITFKMIRDLSHTYPREENVPILKWFDSSLDINETSSRTEQDSNERIDGRRK